MLCTVSIVISKTKADYFYGEILSGRTNQIVCSVKGGSPPYEQVAQSNNGEDAMGISDGLTMHEFATFEWEYTETPSLSL